MVRRMLSVEIHDVSPAAHEEVHAIHSALADLGVPRPTLLVVPRYRDPAGRNWDLRRGGRLVEWLQARQAAGCEIVQHGLTHRASAPPPPGMRNAFMHYWFSRGCAEFAHLDRHQAEARLLLGRRILAACGLHARGFIAPAWQQSPGSIRAVAGLGFLYTAFLNHVLPLRGKREPIPTPALTFDAPAAWIDLGKRAVMGILERLARPARLLRVALHPADVHRPGLLEHILDRVRALMAYRGLVNYAGCLP